MAQQPTFCIHCGYPVNPGVSFCRTCGAQIASYPSITDYSAYQTPSGAVQKQRKRPSIIVIIIGILLIIGGLLGPAALIFGNATTGNIISVEQEIDSSSDRMDYNYQITYDFATTEGKRYTGRYNMNKVYNIANLPDTGSSLLVKYIPFLPNISAPANQGSPVIGMLALCGLGILLVIFGVKGSTAINMGRRI